MTHLYSLILSLGLSILFGQPNCDECWDMLNSSFNDGTEGMISDADSGL